GCFPRARLQISSTGRTRATLLNIKFGISEKDMPFNYRKWNILAFRGRLMSLLVLTHSGVSPRPHLPQESRIFHLLRSEEHTSELQSRFDLVCRLLLEKKK